ncbi:trehalose synthase /maltokinase [Geoalkalibacter ferrihydriticus]|uniref:Maltokinase n=2 Tax=Geoalkalibacter ferrihydriticus TaxID=392333 RepID=A0A0C2HZB5_9BACT|nr:maltose alpha-D-glucosyltransferase [Geoalkalibacter ferrihydriticus]KIH78067.1 alpha-amylase [Geoalkalibacter ferrihydriticus DSM 17813]SDM30882.1 trehalose synthase /maltokinase [Geoalkalibacter ferrihydriticus]
MPTKEPHIDDNPLWYQDAIIYQVHIKAYCDADGNGIGDFRGLISKLDYLQSLGVTAIWVLPFYPSPLRDDGYDIADYKSVNPDYNTLKDFKEFLKQAHARGLRVITELVLNHTSDQHPWFQRARRAKPGSKYRDWYVWNDSPEKYQDARIIFQDFETSNWSWDPIARAYYWHRFYAHQPDLNFENPQVRKEMFKVLDFWFAMGVDGLRLDAVPYLFEREATNCENLPETHAYLQQLRTHIDDKFSNRMLLAEANQWPEDAVAYFGEGNECNMAFHFPIMPRMYMALQMEDRFPLVDILDQTPDVPEGCQWAIFLRNHDELTLEMVTDEERDYMYRTYATDPRARINLGIRRRLAPLLRNNRRKIELMNILLFSLPGTPIIYYGDEIGMGDNYYLGDRDGVRTPMQWSPDRNGGFSAANPQKLYLPVISDPEYNYESVNVENQERNPSSLLWWMRRVIAMRKQFKAFGRGTLEMLLPDNPKVLAFIRRHEDEIILVVVNLSRFSQAVHLDLGKFAGMVPEEVFSHNRFPDIRETPYFLTLGIHDYYWFRLLPERAGRGLSDQAPKLRLRANQSWEQILRGKSAERLCEEVLPDYLARVRWFRSKARGLRKIELGEILPAQSGSRTFQLLLFRVLYTEGSAETYLLPLAALPLASAQSIRDNHPRSVIANLRIGEEDWLLYDAVVDPLLHEIFYGLIAGRRRLKGSQGELAGQPGGGFRKLVKRGESLSSQVLKAEQSNSALVFGDRFFFKLYRMLEDGINPDQELTRHLTEKVKFAHTPTYAGAIEYRRPGSEPMAVGLMTNLVPNQGDAWSFTLDVLSSYIERLLSHRQELPELPEALPGLLEGDPQSLPTHLTETFGTFYLDMAGLLGRRTAEMHQALAANLQERSWRPEEFSTLYQRSVYQSMRALTRRTFTTLQQNLQHLPEDERPHAEAILKREREVLIRLSRIMGPKITSMKIRIHGDYHLGQVLYTGKDFVIIDFEGEPARTLSERRLKRSPLRDVAGMLRSFHYAAMSALRRHTDNHPGDEAFLRPWLDAWNTHVSNIFLHQYIEQLGETRLIPAQRGHLITLLHCFLMEKAVYELGYELNNRPDWISLPLRGIEMILAEKVVS